MNYTLLLLLFCVATTQASEDSDFVDRLQELENAKNDKAGCEIVSRYLSAGGDINFRCCTGRTLLHATVTPYAKFKTAKLLLQRGADPNLSDNGNECPLHVVLLHNCSQKARMVRLLLNHNADVNARDAIGNSYKSAINSFYLYHKRDYHIWRMLLECTAPEHCTEPMQSHPKVVRLFKRIHTAREEHLRVVSTSPDVIKLIMAYT